MLSEKCVKPRKVVLFQRMAATVGTEWLAPEDLPLFKAHANKPQEEPQCRWGIDIATVGLDGFLIRATGYDLSDEYREKVLDAYRKAGFSQVVLDIIEAAQRQMVETIRFDPDGTILERRELPKLPKIGKRKLGKKAVKELLADLECLHDSSWPIEMLTNTLRPVFLKTRRR